MQVKIKPSKDECGYGLSSFASWQNQELIEALENLFHINKTTEVINSIEITEDGITARLGRPHSYETKTKKR